MSAKHEKRDGFVFFPYKRLNLSEESFLCDQFEKFSDMDEKEIIDQLNLVKTLKKLCISKTFLFPFEYTFTFIFLGKEKAKIIYKCQRLYWNFLKGRITLEKFERLLNEFLGEMV